MTDLDVHTDTTPRHPRWVRCGRTTPDGQPCGERVYNDRDDRAAHLRRHDREDHVRAQLRNLGNEIDGLRKQLALRPVPDTDDTVEDWTPDATDTPAEDAAVPQLLPVEDTAEDAGDSITIPTSAKLYDPFA